MKGNKIRILGLILVCIGLLMSVYPVEAAAPTVNTTQVRGFGSNWLELTGNVTSDGGVANITQLGFNYGTSNSTYLLTSNTTYTNYTIATYGYYTYINNLNPQTLYHYRATAFNGSWGYDGDLAFSTAGASVSTQVEWENYINTTSVSRTVYSNNWITQTFNINEIAHTITAVDLWLQRVGSPGDVTVVIQTAGSSSTPIGSPLCTGTITAQYTGNLNPVSNNMTRYRVTMTPEISLPAGAKYCITVSAVMGDPSNYLIVGGTNPNLYFPQGASKISSDSGVIWTSPGESILFDIWGRGCLQVDHANIFNTYKDSGDWLIVFFYRNVFPPYYPIQDSKQYFAYQLVDQYNNVKAQQACSQWGVKPGSIYLSSNMVVPLQWSGAYRVRLVNLKDNTVYMEYPLQSSDWLGTDLTLLDSWVISTAQQLQLYDNVPYIVAVAGRGNVLNSAGGVIFATGIPLLDALRPNLFQVVSQSAGTTVGVYPQTTRAKYTPVLMLGPDAWATMVSIGAIFGVDGRTIGVIGILGIVLVIAGWGFQPGHTVAATVLSFPVLILGMLTGLIDVLVGALVLAIVLGIFTWKTVFQGG